MTFSARRKRALTLVLAGFWPSLVLGHVGADGSDIEHMHTQGITQCLS